MLVYSCLHYLLFKNENFFLYSCLHYLLFKNEKVCFCLLRSNVSPISTIKQDSESGVVSLC